MSGFSREVCWKNLILLRYVLYYAGENVLAWTGL
jgi:hypothetical protein